jgi:hypothetical protein
LIKNFLVGSDRAALISSGEKRGAEFAVLRPNKISHVGSAVAKYRFTYWKK